MTMQAERSSPVAQQVDVQTAALDVKTIKSIELPSGWVNVAQCQLTQFAVGQAHSPISPAKLYPTLRYTSNGKEVFTPLRNILSFSQEVIR